jgi:hypothetical protein
LVVASTDLRTLQEACDWASIYLGREVTPNNISYLIQYAKIHVYDPQGNLKKRPGGDARISLSELKQYYDKNWKKEQWEEVLGKGINWNLSFDNLREAERTKHVHRLHPYKGKFIPQLVEYFLDEHVNDFKGTIFFHQGDIVLDPFVGSGTTLVQCLELGIHSIGIDISEFNCVISKVKTEKHDLKKLGEELRKAAKITEEFSQARFCSEREAEMDRLLSSINGKYFPSPEFKFLVGRIRDFQYKIKEKTSALSKGDLGNAQQLVGEVSDIYKDERTTLEEQIENFARRNSIYLDFRITTERLGNLADEFVDTYSKAVLEETLKRTPRHAQMKLVNGRVETFADAPFLSRWFTERQRAEMKCYLDQISLENDPETRDVMRIVLSRAVRSCRATKHIDLATLITPQSEPYYCRKHFRICKPLTSIVRHLMRYTEDTIKRIREFQSLRKNVFCEVINDDSSSADIFTSISNKNDDFCRLLKNKRIDGVFTSPPYVGQIDYHEQHAYAYELFDIERKDSLEIGRKAKGTGRAAQIDYVAGISAVLLNVKKYLKNNAHIFIVANDKKNLYPTIAERSGLEIADVFRRPVLNRTERDKQPYSESIFHMVSD